MELFKASIILADSLQKCGQTLAKKLPSLTYVIRSEMDQVVNEEMDRWEELVKPGLLMKRNLAEPVSHFVFSDPVAGDRVFKEIFGGGDQEPLIPTTAWR